jgi:hypothetical protein
MSFNEVLAELPALSVEQRQLLVRRAVELDDPGLSTAAERVVDQRLAGHYQNPSSSVSAVEMSTRLRSRFCQ